MKQCRNVSGVNDKGLQFPPIFDVITTFGPNGSGEACFGTNVLRRLTSGIDEFLTDPQRRWEQYRSLGPVLLGAVPWLTDGELLDQIANVEHACVVITKQPRGGAGQGALRRLAQIAAEDGIWTGHFYELSELAYPLDDGTRPVLGPSSGMPDVTIPAIRSLGFRSQDNQRVPLLHAKIFLLGHLWWHDEDALGGAADVTGFKPKRLWLASANGTLASRNHLEFGMWTEDPDLLRAARQFLLRLIGESETFDPDSDTYRPELVNVDYDDDAMAEASLALREYYGDLEDEV